MIDATELHDSEVVCDTCHLTHHKELGFCPECHPEKSMDAYAVRCVR